MLDGLKKLLSVGRVKDSLKPLLIKMSGRS